MQQQASASVIIIISAAFINVCISVSLSVCISQLHIFAPADFYVKDCVSECPRCVLLVFIGPIVWPQNQHPPPPLQIIITIITQCRDSNPAPCDDCPRPIRGQHRGHVTSTDQSEAEEQPVKLSPPIITGEGRTSKGWKMINCCRSENRNKGQHCHKQFSARESHWARWKDE